MALLARWLKRIAPRLLYGSAAYWGANVALVAIEVRWHPLYRLTLWDIAQLKPYAPLLQHLVRFGS
jgi:hypothetical protein